jgi:hypothetical protein
LHAGITCLAGAGQELHMGVGAKIVALLIVEEF